MKGTIDGGADGAAAGANMVGMGSDFSAAIRYDVSSPPPEATLPDEPTLGDIEGAEQVLAGLPPEEQEKPEIKGLRARFRFDRVAAAAPDPDQLETALARNPDNSEARYQLAVQLLVSGQLEPALDELLELLKPGK